MAPTQPIKPKPTSATEPTLFFGEKPNKLSSNFVPRSSPDIHTLISPASSISTAQATPFKVQIGHRRTHPGTLFPNPPVNSSILNLTVRHGPQRTVTSPRMLSPAVDARIAATGALNQSQGISFKFAPHGLSRRRFVS